MRIEPRVRSLETIECRYGSARLPGAWRLQITIRLVYSYNILEGFNLVRLWELRPLVTHCLSFLHHDCKEWRFCVLTDLLICLVCLAFKHVFESILNIKIFTILLLLSSFLYYTSVIKRYLSLFQLLLFII